MILLLLEDNTLPFWPNIPFCLSGWCGVAWSQLNVLLRKQNCSGSTLVEMIILATIHGVSTMCQALPRNLHVLLLILINMWYRYYYLWLYLLVYWSKCSLAYCFPVALIHCISMYVEPLSVSKHWGPDLVQLTLHYITR